LVVNDELITTVKEIELSNLINLQFFSNYSRLYFDSPLRDLHLLSLKSQTEDVYISDSTIVETLFKLTLQYLFRVKVTFIRLTLTVQSNA